MIQVQITARHYEVDDELKKYIQRKLAKLDKYLPRRHTPKGMSVEIMRDPSGKEDNKYKVRAILEVPGPDIIAETATMNPHAAIDIVSEKLRIQISKYKQKHQIKRLRIKEWFSGPNQER